MRNNSGLDDFTSIDTVESLLKLDCDIPIMLDFIIAYVFSSPFPVLVIQTL